jgi:hypothetical protein
MKKKISWLVSFLLLASLVSIPSAKAVSTVTWYQISDSDTYNRPDLNPAYDIQYVTAQKFDSDTEDTINFFLFFANPITSSLFDDSFDSWAGILLDFNNDGKLDLRLKVQGQSYPTDAASVPAQVYDERTSQYLNCDARTWSNIATNVKWIGFTVSKKCIGLPQTFGMKGYSDYKSNDEFSFDYAPDAFYTVSLPGASGVAANPIYVLPSSVANASSLVSNFSSPPDDLSALSAKLKPSIVTVLCANGSGTGWSADVDLSASMKAAGFESYVITNNHVIADCTNSKQVSLILNDGSTVPGTLITWDSNADVAAIATRTLLPSLQWFGSEPIQGWWAGVIGSPLGKPGILTTGIISSINALTSTFTLTAPINPGNSGGPVFDSTGRVLGLATSKNLLSSGQLAEGFGNAQGTPLLCGLLVQCVVELHPWGTKSRFVVAFPESEVVAAAAKARLDAEAKAKADADAQAARDKILADAKAAADEMLAEAQAALNTAKKAVQKKVTITCVKGNLIKKVTASQSKCPTGYKKK